KRFQGAAGGVVFAYVGVEAAGDGVDGPEDGVVGSGDIAVAGFGDGEGFDACFDAVEVDFDGFGSVVFGFVGFFVAVGIGCFCGVLGVVGVCVVGIGIVGAGIGVAIFVVFVAVEGARFLEEGAFDVVA